MAAIQIYANKGELQGSVNGPHPDVIPIDTAAFNVAIHSATTIS